MDSPFRIHFSYLSFIHLSIPIYHFDLLLVRLHKSLIAQDFVCKVVILSLYRHRLSCPPPPHPIFSVDQALLVANSFGAMGSVCERKAGDDRRRQV